MHNNSLLGQALGISKELHINVSTFNFKLTWLVFKFQYSGKFRVGEMGVGKMGIGKTGVGKTGNTPRKKIA